MLRAALVSGRLSVKYIVICLITYVYAARDVARGTGLSKTHAHDLEWQICIYGYQQDTHTTHIITCIMKYTDI